MTIIIVDGDRVFAQDAATGFEVEISPGEDFLDVPYSELLEMAPGELEVDGNSC